MTDKFTNRFDDDPFGVAAFKRGDYIPPEWNPPKWPPAPATPVQSPLVAQAGGAGSLTNYRKTQEAEAAREAAAATASPATPAAPSTSPIVVPRPVAGGAPLVAAPQSPPPAPAPQPTTADLIRDEMKLQLLRGLFPQHRIEPVEYDPWKAVPQGLGTKVNVNEGVE